MRTFKLGLVATVGAAAAIAVPAVAHADSKYFQSPSGNIVCMLGADGAACDIHEYTFTPPPPPECAQHIKWGNRFAVEPGKPGHGSCHGDTLAMPGEPTLNYGQTISAGTITCASSEQAGIKCTESGGGHFFQVSRDSFQLG
ncbi:MULTISPECIES: DUF6636 domain-containing protein [Mycobacterium]|uniref:Ig-like domain-containing protein n=1 Tax=Mycobacterium kiyosense TaxID=2871094 RepID=A0A9P3UZE1_9MYCO|nr:MULTISPECIES: DUF6636 domain-containing protein [Mycobacterium]BDB41927.1 hypothetical protein IWGMT90018_23730 [Mycobacterium kiyosense]BDE14786.1 hypothetical protein MKCMC460_36460 [Mycobacterium sp. 20KCMC460]GLB84224.1 hypothetical protein SRL2020028_34800 [Mycobacterium kiyosense]GLB91733.1 hypothetical protein SRL2020130_45500 [Mycobacterium kiyosense]GLB96750.1 hypothetical protein SRL2020226_35260 [Mycobacterium kiyosense]